jgi:ubiquinone biosynthesis protein UbiJ
LNNPSSASSNTDVAQRYASIAHLKDVETRLTEHLLRIEAKLGQPARM